MAGFSGQHYNFPMHAARWKNQLRLSSLERQKYRTGFKSINLYNQGKLTRTHDLQVWSKDAQEGTFINYVEKQELFNYIL